MVTYTNKHNLPGPLYKALSEDNYSRGKADISVTSLLGPPKVEILQAVHKEFITVDVTERLAALFGTAIHEIIARGAEGMEGYVSEERLFAEVAGWTISGGIDLQEPDHKTKTVAIKDWKTTTVYGVQHPKRDWELQLNCYAYLVKQVLGLTATSLQIGALIKDWSASKARFDKNYPQCQIAMIDLPLWPEDQQEAYVLERVRTHQEAAIYYEMSHQLPECTPEEMWEQGGGFAIMKRGGKRAHSVHDNRDDATDVLTMLNATTPTTAAPIYLIEHRQGRRVRCEEYCSVNKFCLQYAEYKDDQEIVI